MMKNEVRRLDFLWGTLPICSLFADHNNMVIRPRWTRYGFIWMSPLGECLHRIAVAAAMVDEFG
jgi:hypothetical protein